MQFSTHEMTKYAETKIQNQKPQGVDIHGHLPKSLVTPLPLDNVLFLIYLQKRFGSPGEDATTRLLR